MGDRLPWPFNRASGRGSVNASKHAVAILRPYTKELRLSILIPVYNERTMVERSLAQVLAAPLPEKMEKPGG